MRQCRIIYILMMSLGIPQITYAFYWPMLNTSNNFRGPLTVTAVFGDYRNTDEHTFDPATARFHNGIDIGATNGQVVYPIESGYAYRLSIGTTNETVVVIPQQSNNFYHYVHVNGGFINGTYLQGIDNNPDSIPNNPLNMATVNGNHLHLKYGNHYTGKYLNPLYTNGGPANYTDNYYPDVSDITFYRETATSENDFPINNTPFPFQGKVYGKTKIRAKCYTPKSGGDNCGIYALLSQC